MKLDGIAAFIAVVEGKSISEAARRLKLSKSIVSERLTELERSLGATLLQRTTRKLTLTEDGAAFYERARRIARHVDAAAAEVSERRGILSGPLRIAAPVSLGSLHVGPALYPFLQAHPAIELTLELDDRFVDVAADGYDAVIRHSHISDTHVVVKQLATSRRVLVASPEYLKCSGRPASLVELGKHRAIVYTNRGASDWKFQKAGRTVVVRTMNGMRVNNGLVMRDAAIAGLGVALLPMFLVDPARAAGRLDIIDVGAEAEGAVIYIAYPKDKRVSAKVRALTDCLRDAFVDMGTRSRK